MTAQVHLLCGPAGTGKSRRLMRRYHELAGAGFGQVLWLAPTRRAVEQLKPRLLAGLPGCLAPNVWTFQDFVEEIIRVNDPTAQPLSELQKRLLVSDLIMQMRDKGELPHFDKVSDTRGFTEAMLALLSELKRNEIWPREFAHAARLRQRGPGETPEPLFSAAESEPSNDFSFLDSDGIAPKDLQCTRLYARYQEHLVRHRLYDVEGRYWYARDLLRRGRRAPFAGVRAVFVDGFTDLTRTQHDILQFLCQWVTELWITLPNETGDERAELFRRPQLTLKRLRAIQSTVMMTDSQNLREGLGPAADVLRPAGLAHLERQLFRPARKVQVSDNAEGLRLLEAPGLLGEARLVARAIKTLLRQGTPPDDILVSMRDLLPYADLAREVFTEYGIPVDIEGAEPLLRVAAVSTLTRALRLSEEGWPFGGVTALLRSTYFRPTWPEATPPAGTPVPIAWQAEVLLRLLNEPRDRAAYLRAVQNWADNPPPLLEDEQAAEHLHRRKHELALRCRPFLQRFFAAWDSAPARGDVLQFTVWLRRFADNLGLTSAAAEDDRDQRALRRLWDELEQWGRLEERLFGGRLRDLGQFARLLSILAAGVGLARTPRGVGRVRVLSAELAVTLDVPYLFVMGLGERGFPRLTAATPLFDESERLSLRQAGLRDLPCLVDMMPDEMLLFYRLVTRPQRQLFLSYPAVDDKGQPLLPSSFLNTVLDCFTPEAIHQVRQRRHMLIEGYDSDEPLSPAEQRVRLALCLRENSNPSLLPHHSGRVASSDLIANLHAAHALAHYRFEDKHHNAFDGALRHPLIVRELAAEYGPEKVFSPTALESYIDCPFRFFMRHVLRLEPFEDPREEIEQTRRGQAFHRALTRLHEELKAVGQHQPNTEASVRLVQHLDKAIQEDIERAPSPATKVLWQLEGQRLRRWAERYAAQWQKFIEPWRKVNILPQPYLFEASFGFKETPAEPKTEPLIIQVNGTEVRLGGRVDRIDWVELEGEIGFWIIDYKTGKAHHYNKQDLMKFSRLQLTLYALAVEKVILAGRRARPLGLAYWLVVDKDGPKPVTPAAGRNQTPWLNDPSGWQRVREQLEQWVTTLVEHIRQGAFHLRPRLDTCTERCDFARMCRITQSRPYVEQKSGLLPLPVIEADSQELDSSPA
ncbi:MAG: PD-(D/E)XK nuclease family protein [Gemmataceae bacterium]